MSNAGDMSATCCPAAVDGEEEVSSLSSASKGTTTAICSICFNNLLDSPTVGYITDCRHSFCIGCLVSLFCQQGACPLCRCSVSRFAILGTSTTVEYAALNIPLMDTQDTSSTHDFNIGGVVLPFIGWGNAEELRKRAEAAKAIASDTPSQTAEDTANELSCLDWHFFSEEANKLQRRCDYLRKTLKGNLVATFASSSLPTARLDQLEDALQVFQISVIDVVNPVESLTELYAMEEKLIECEKWRSSAGVNKPEDRKIYGADDLLSDEDDEDEASSSESEESDCCGHRHGVGGGRGNNGRKADEKASAVQQQHRRGGSTGSLSSFVIKEASPSSQKERKLQRKLQMQNDNTQQRDFRRGLPRNL